MKPKFCNTRLVLMTLWLTVWRYSKALILLVMCVCLKLESCPSIFKQISSIDCAEINPHTHCDTMSQIQNFWKHRNIRISEKWWLFQKRLDFCWRNTTCLRQHSELPTCDGALKHCLRKYLREVSETMYAKHCFSVNHV